MAEFEPVRFGDYILTAHLGRGGMANVFRAQRVGAAGFERTVVVKRILDAHTADPNFVKMFINEAKLAARLTHPNIVQVYELGEIASEFFMAMEFINGKDLLRIMRAVAGRPSAALPPAVAAFIARETCRALSHAHAHSDEGQDRPIVHRDVSPQNIMIGYDGHVKLVDFGIAKALSSLTMGDTKTGTLKGKFAYMAPEQIAGVAPGPQSDIFATGVVLHEMLTGRRLFKGNSDLETLQRVKSMEIPAPSIINNDVPATLDRIVLQALARNRSQRYANAGTMARELELVLQEARFTIEDMAEFLAELFPKSGREAIASSSSHNVVVVSPTEPVTQDLRRRRFMLPLSVIAAGLVATVMVVGHHRENRLKVSSGKDVPVIVEPMQSVHSEPTKAAVVAAPLIATVKLLSEPSGADVYRGPRLLGTTPMTIAADQIAAAPISLLKEGYRELHYQVQTSDGPEVTLRLERRVSARPLPPLPPIIARPNKAHDKTKKPQVELFDDDKKANRRPKVDAVDD